MQQAEQQGIDASDGLQNRQQVNVINGSSSPMSLPSIGPSIASSSQLRSSRISHPDPQPSNRFSQLISSQEIAIIDTFELESGDVLQDVQVAYKTWGRLNDRKDNCMVICHALTGSADVEDWWGPMLGRDLAFDPSRYFIFCANVLGSPYGSASPVTNNPATGLRWGPEFPLATIRDDVRLHKLILDYLGVNSVAVVIGGSMGGMQVLEWACMYAQQGFVRNIIPIATSAHHSAWGISWGEAQRQAIYSDPNYEEGYYSEDRTPTSGLAAARMAALLTYRSRDSFESRFGRREMESRHGSPSHDNRPANRARDAHNNGYRTPAHRDTALRSAGNPDLSEKAPASPTQLNESLAGAAKRPLVYSAQSYLRYQGDKFTSRFDANCYIAISRKMDSHDITRGRWDHGSTTTHPLQKCPAGALLLAISSDALFTLDEQREMTDRLPESELVVIESPEGHDGFLLEFEQINDCISRHLRKRLPEIYAAQPLLATQEAPSRDVADKFAVKKDSVFGEAEADITAW